MAQDFEETVNQKDSRENDEYKIERRIRLFGWHKKKYYNEEGFLVSGNKRGLFGYTVAFRNKKTGKLYKERFLYAHFINKNVAVVEINDNEWTFFDLKTGKAFEQKFNGKYMGFSNGWAPVQIGDKYTFFNPITGKLCTKMFESTLSNAKDNSYYKGWAPVKIGDKWTFFNLETEELCEQRFDYLSFISEGWASVRIGNQSTYFNIETKEICEQRFVKANDVKDGIAQVVILNEAGYYNDRYFEPSSGKIFIEKPQEKSRAKGNQQEQHPKNEESYKSRNNGRERV